MPFVVVTVSATLTGFDLGTWFGVLAPVATPREVMSRLSTEVINVIKSPTFKKRMEEIGAEPIGNSPEQMAQQIRADVERYAALVKKANVVIE